MSKLTIGHLSDMHLIGEKGAEGTMLKLKDAGGDPQGSLERCLKELSEERPPDILYHGTAEKYVDSIEKKGLLPRGRLYVHLSRDRETAISVGRRHGSPIVYRIDSQRMYLDGISFYRSENDVWLVKYVPFEYMIME